MKTVDAALAEMADNLSRSAMAVDAMLADKSNDPADVRSLLDEYAGHLKAVEEKLAERRGLLRVQMRRMKAQTKTAP